MQATVFIIGARKVRSAGRASGSVEITLPPELAAFQGVECRIVLRDGARPEIVLEPDLARAVETFTRTWVGLRSLLRLAGDIGEFPAQECDLALLPGQRQNGRPLLIYSHAWQVSLCDQRVDGTAPPGSEQRAALAGLIAPLATVGGHRMGLVGLMAATFGTALASLTAPAAGSESFECGATRRIWKEVCGPETLTLDIGAASGHETCAQQALQRIVSQFRAWQEQPDVFALARAQWTEGIGQHFGGFSAL